MDNKIFITLGSQKFQFNRLLKAVDELCEKGTIDAEDVFAQIGYSDYIPKNFSYKKFLDRDEFSNEMEKANIVITHGGTGAIIGAVKKGKKVIAVPRRAKYGEHVDDHSLSSGNLSSIQPALRHLIDFITVQHQVGCESVMLVKKDVLVLNGQKLVQGMQVHKQLMLKIMSEGIAVHHLLCLFVRLAIDKNQWLIKIERK